MKRNIYLLLLDKGKFFLTLLAINFIPIIGRDSQYGEHLMKSRIHEKVGNIPLPSLSSKNGIMLHLYAIAASKFKVSIPRARYLCSVLQHTR